MTALGSNLSRFRVRARHEDPHHGRIVLETSFEAAAIAYVEHLPAADHRDISVVVHDIDSGQEHSFLVHVDGEAAGPG